MFECITDALSSPFPDFVCGYNWEVYIFGVERLNPFPNKPWFSCVCSISLENTGGKGEIARNEQFLLFPQWFLTVWRTICHFRIIPNCRLQSLSVWKSLKFVVWERVKEINSFMTRVINLMSIDLATRSYVKGIVCIQFTWYFLISYDCLMYSAKLSDFIVHVNCGGFAVLE